MSGQLHLFKSKRQRGIKSPAPLEFAIHCMVADTLRRWATPDWIYTHIPLGERRDEVTGARLKRMGVQPGWPDFILIPPLLSGDEPWTVVLKLCLRPHFLELKRKGHKLTEHQAGFALWCKLNRCPHAVCDTYEAAVAVLKQWGAVQAGVRVQ